MKRIRGVIDAATVAMLIKPVTRWLMARLRKTAMDYARTTIGDPAQALWQAALPGQPALLDTGAAMTSADTTEARDRRDVLRSVLVAGAVAALVAGSAFAIAAVVRSRRKAPAPGSAAPTVQRVAVPVAAPSGKRDEADDRGSATEDGLRSIKGIGTETSKRLRSHGITSIEQIAAWSPEDVRTIAEQMELGAARIEREDWVGQARAASGVTTGAG